MDALRVGQGNSSPIYELPVSFRAEESCRSLEVAETWVKPIFRIFGDPEQRIQKITPLGIQENNKGSHCEPKLVAIHSGLWQYNLLRESRGEAL